MALSLRNFKGIGSLDIQFGQETDILGQNGTGKTTVVDAFLWLLFGKDSTDRKDFEIKTLDKNNQPFHERSHEVKGTFLFGTEEVVLKRIYREKWTKKHGNPTPQFTGHTTEFFWNDVPYQEKEYQAKLAEYIQESQFKLLTNLAYFNEVLKWQDRRSLLMQLAGGATDLELATELNTSGQYDHLVKALQQKKSIEDYRKEIVAKKNTIKRENEALPDRIDEARRSIPAAADYEAIEAQIIRLTEELQGVEQRISDKGAAEQGHQQQIIELIKEKGILEREILQLKQGIQDAVLADKRNRETGIVAKRMDIKSKEDEKARLLSDYNRLSSKVESDKAAADKLELRVALTRTMWNDVNSETFTFDPSSCTCPTCKQPLPDVDAAAREEELKKNFNADKSRRLTEINERGIALKSEVDAMKKAIELSNLELGNTKAKGEKMAEEIASLKRELSILEEDNNRRSELEAQDAEDRIAKDPRILQIKEQIEALEAQINTPRQADEEMEQLQQRKRNLNAELDSLKKVHAGKDMTEKLNERIKELMRQESESASAIAELEGFEFSLQEYDKAKMALVEAKINTRFRLVKFKLFEEQINGGTTPTCITLINGVPYPDANTASKINASLDIIHVFSDHFGVKAPVFIDNRESVLKLIATPLQLINLIVSKDDYDLRVVAKDRQPAELFV